MVAKATKIGSLYQLNHKPNHEQASFAEKADTKEDIWHKRFGHLGIGSLQKLAREDLVNGFDYDATRKLTFCESCPQGGFTFAPETFEVELEFGLDVISSSSSSSSFDSYIGDTVLA